jgi:hypothetical protein
MDFEKLIKKLRKERSALDDVIASHVAARAAAETKAAVVQKRRGRKSMSLEERRGVAERMKKYWARRRQAKLARDLGRGD